jgi:hypothetical protein
LVEIASKGCNHLLNIGPTGDGPIPKKAVFEILFASGIGPSGPKAGRRPPLIRTSAINASGYSGLRVRHMTD